MQLGRKIQEVRLQKKLTQREVVGEYMTRNMLSKIENGSATPSVKTLEYIAAALGVPVGYFLSDGAETLDGAQLTEISALADMLIADAAPEDAYGIAMCIKARVMLAAGDAEGAVALLGDAEKDGRAGRTLDLICRVMEDAYKAMDDYKMAYEYATKRISL